MSEIKLELGKRYVLGSGKITQPLTKQEGEAVYPFWDDEMGASFAENGVHDLNFPNSQYNIVSLYQEPLPPGWVDINVRKPTLEDGLKGSSWCSDSRKVMYMRKNTGVLFGDWDLRDDEIVAWLPLPEFKTPPPKKKVKVALGPQDIPVDALFRQKGALDGILWKKIWELHPSYVGIGNGLFISFNWLMENYEISRDLGETWVGCFKEV